MMLSWACVKGTVLSGRYGAAKWPEHERIHTQRAMQGNRVHSVSRPLLNMVVMTGSKQKVRWMFAMFSMERARMKK
eukprot:2392798-Amphidinium_carterae.1